MGEKGQGELPNGTRQGDHLDAPGTRTAERGRALVDSRAGRVDVVEHADPTRHIALGDDAAADVPAALREAEAPLPLEAPRSPKEVIGGNRPGDAQRLGQCRGRDPAPLQGALGIAGDVGKDVHLRPCDRLGDEPGRFCGQPAPAVLLPDPDERTRARVVHDRGARARKRETPSRALGAPPHRPGARRAAALADRRHEPNEAVAAVSAERRTGARAEGAALRKEELEHPSIVGGYSLRLCEKT
jgi:hypothetical protein